MTSASRPRAIGTLPTLLTSRAPAPAEGNCKTKGGDVPKSVIDQLQSLTEEYAAPVRVRNTFIDTSEERSPSLERFFREREVNTCPSAHVGCLRNLFLDCEVGGEAARNGRFQAEVLGSPQQRVAASPKFLPPPLVLSLDALCPRQQALRETSDEKASLQPFGLLEGSGSLTIDEADVPSPPKHAALGSAELPSMGSAGHATGSCKPCAFFHTVGCTSDLTCDFCHLCEAGERKRRRKEKLEAKRAAHRSRQNTKPQK